MKASKVVNAKASIKYVLFSSYFILNFLALLIYPLSRCVFMESVAFSFFNQSVSVFQTR